MKRSVKLIKQVVITGINTGTHADNRNQNFQTNFRTGAAINIGTP